MRPSSGDVYSSRRRTPLLRRPDAEDAPQSVCELEALLRTVHVIALHTERPARARDDDVPVAARCVAALRADGHRVRLRVDAGTPDDGRVIHPAFVEPRVAEECEPVL